MDVYVLTIAAAISNGTPYQSISTNASGRYSNPEPAMNDTKWHATCHPLSFDGTALAFPFPPKPLLFLRLFALASPYPTCAEPEVLILCIDDEYVS